MSAGSGASLVMLAGSAYSIGAPSWSSLSPSKKKNLRWQRGRQHVSRQTHLVLARCIHCPECLHLQAAVPRLSIVSVVTPYKDRPSMPDGIDMSQQHGDNAN